MRAYLLTIIISVLLQGIFLKDNSLYNPLYSPLYNPLHAQTQTQVISSNILSNTVKAIDNSEKRPWEQLDIPNVSQAVLDASMWVNKHPHPHKPILSSSEIESMNRKLYKRGYLVHPLFVEKYISGLMVSNYITSDLQWIRRYIKYDINRVRRRDPKFTDYLKSLIGFKFNKVSRIRFGVITKGASLRAFPTEMILARNTNDYDFDILQRSAVYYNQEVAIYHTSTDGKWHYIQSHSGTGWIDSKAVSISDKTVIKKYIEKKGTSGVVINPWAKIIKKDKTIQKVPMGTQLVVKETSYNQKENEGSYEVILPMDNEGALAFSSGYIKKSDFSPTYLKLTYSNIVLQAFKMLGEPYTWGGKGLHTDCSSFLQRVFKTMGIILPRASNLQIKHLNNTKDISSLSKQSKQDAIVTLPPAQSLIFLYGPNHIMLYLGEYKDKPYVIHNTWSFKNAEDKEELIQKVVITDFELGAGKQGSLLDRVSKIGSF